MDDLKLYGANRDQTMRMFSEDIKMSFGLKKCTVLEMKSERKFNRAEIELQDDKHIGKV